MALLTSMKLFGMESDSIAETFKPEFYKLVSGTLSLPINLPGTNYLNAFQVQWFAFGLPQFSSCSYKFFTPLLIYFSLNTSSGKKENY